MTKETRDLVWRLFSSLDDETRRRFLSKIKEVEVLDFFCDYFCEPDDYLSKEYMLPYLASLANNPALPSDSLKIILDKAMLILQSYHEHAHTILVAIAGRHDLTDKKISQLLSVGGKDLVETLLRNHHIPFEGMVMIKQQVVETNDVELITLMLDNVMATLEEYVKEQNERKKAEQAKL